MLSEGAVEQRELPTVPPSIRVFIRVRVVSFKTFTEAQTTTGKNDLTPRRHPSQLSCAWLAQDHFTEKESLTSLNIGGARGVRDGGIAALAAQCCRLQSLNMSGAHQVTDVAIREYRTETIRFLLEHNEKPRFRTDTASF